MRNLLIILFIVLLLIPAAGWIAGFDYELDENRTRIQSPDVNMNTLILKNFYNDFDSYFNDNFNLRGLMIYSKNWLDYNLFNTSPSPKIHMGKDGWLFYRSYLLNDYNKSSCKEKPFIEQMFLYLHALENIFQSAGKEFIITVAPSKATIYADEVGFSPNENKCGKSIYDLFLDEQSSNPLKGFVKLDDVLLNAKTSEQIYFRTDSHWNTRGAEIATNQVLAALKRDMSPAAQDSYEYYETDFYGDVGKMVGMPISERATLLKNTFEDQETLTTRTPDFHIALKSDSASPGIPSGLFYRDSFGGWMLPYLQNSFKHLDAFLTLHVPSTYLGGRSSYEDYRTYDAIIVQAIEGGLKNIRVDIRRVVSYLGNDLDLPDAKPIEMSRILPLKNIKISRSKESLLIQSAGKGSMFSIPHLESIDRKAFKLLRMSIESPAKDYMNIYYTSKEHPYYKHPNQQLNLIPGRQDIYIPLPFWEDISVVINPGTKFGIFTLHSADIIEFPY